MRVMVKKQAVGDGLPGNELSRCKRVSSITCQRSNFERRDDPNRWTGMGAGEARHGGGTSSVRVIAR